MSDFMRLAEIAAQLGTCSRAKVGAVFVKDGQGITTGWNGMPTGQPRCEHNWSTLPCKDAIHAEVRAIGFSAALGRKTEGGTLYVTMSPCLSCAQLISIAGITDVVYRDEYRKLDGLDFLSNAGVRVVRA